MCIFIPHILTFWYFLEPQNKQRKRCSLLATAGCCTLNLFPLFDAHFSGMCALMHAQKSMSVFVLLFFFIGVSSFQKCCFSVVLGLRWSHSSHGWELHPLHQSPWWGNVSSEVIGLPSAFSTLSLAAFLCHIWLVVGRGDLETFCKSKWCMCSCTGLQHEGIFRVSGSQVEVNDIKNAFERGSASLLQEALL